MHLTRPRVREPSALSRNSTLGLHLASRRNPKLDTRTNIVGGDTGLACTSSSPCRSNFRKFVPTTCTRAAANRGLEGSPTGRTLNPYFSCTPSHSQPNCCPSMTARRPLPGRLAKTPQTTLTPHPDRKLT